jgi:hypothetical protein
VPKLPADFVKPPGFDNPLRATAGKLVVAKDGHDLVIHFEDDEWKAIEEACAQEGVTPEALVRRAVDRWVRGGFELPPAPQAPVPELPPAPGDSWRPGGLLGSLVDRVEARLMARFGWLRRFVPTSLQRT